MEHDIRRIAREFLDTLYAHGFSAAVEQHGADTSFWASGLGEMSDVDASRDTIISMTKSGKLEPVIHGLTVEGDRVAVEAELLAPLKNGKTYHNFYHYLLTFRDGKVTRVKEYHDSAHAMAIFSDLIAA